ncbi:MAG: HAMP domain-containing sensor histidine kinase [Candidatus Latescibacteria bacterium]|jgi:signal transduction histidine kinase|nr:HAMP domain-containing sensor histidine kinase [Candidatus Latescibacterota bacterium]MDP7447082.1 HAMP domain-containing sensor histidine kinase [Candidatus Latescibacterota bacterium]HJP32799.1 HAMP domain-containing sensor histidine kinase [Candidatus Latescibacterota bacterium]
MSSEQEWLDALCVRQRLDVFGELAGGVAHQLNNALSVVNGYEELLLEALDDESSKAAPDIDELRTRARTVHTWTGTALSVARRLHSMSAHMREERGPLDVNGLAAEAVDLCRYRCERENILLIADLSDGLPLVIAHPGELLQVMVNLVQNAREAIDRANGTDGGTIRLTTTGHEGGVCIAVEDDGPGVAADEVESIFAVGRSAKSGPGVGLGLPVSRRIAQRCGGSLSAEAGADEGARFLIDLPSE